MPVRVMSHSKQVRKTRPSEPEFGYAGILIGVGVGNIAGVVVEITRGGGRLALLAGAVAGCILGGIFELVRFLARRRAFTAARKR